MLSSVWGSRRVATTHITGVRLSSDLLCEYWIEIVAMEPPCIIFTFLIRINYRGVLSFVAGCSCGVWCRGLTTCTLCVGQLSGKVVLSELVCNTVANIVFIITFIVYEFIDIYSLILSFQYRNSHYKDRIVSRPSHLYNGIPYTVQYMIPLRNWH